jgi:hypothetical protein
MLWPPATAISPAPEYYVPAQILLDWSMPSMAQVTLRHQTGEGSRSAATKSNARYSYSLGRE